MAEPYEPHSYVDEIPDVAVTSVLSWARAVDAREPGAIELASSLALERYDGEALASLSADDLMSRIFMGLIQDPPPIGPWAAIQRIFGDEGTPAVLDIYDAWEEDHSVGEQPPAGLEARIRERVASGVHNAADLRWLAQHGPRLLTLVPSQD